MLKNLSNRHKIHHVVMLTWGTLWNCHNRVYHATVGIGSKCPATTLTRFWPIFLMFQIQISVLRIAICIKHLCCLFFFCFVSILEWPWLLRARLEDDIMLLKLYADLANFCAIQMLFFHFVLVSFTGIGDCENMFDATQFKRLMQTLCQFRSMFIPSTPLREFNIIQCSRLRP